MPPPRIWRSVVLVIPFAFRGKTMRKSIFVTLAVALGAAVAAFSQAGAPQQTPPAAAQAGSPAAGQPAVAAAQQQAAAAAPRQQLQQAIQSLQQRLRARYAADVPPEQLQQQIQQLQQQLQELGPAPAPGAFGGAGGRGGPPGAGFGAGRGGAGRGGPIVVPDDATPDQLRGFIQQLQQQNQQLNQRITAGQPPRTPPPPPGEKRGPRKKAVLRHGQGRPLRPTQFSGSPFSGQRCGIRGHPKVSRHLGFGLRIPGRRGQGFDDTPRPHDRRGQEAVCRGVYHLSVLAHASADRGRTRQGEP